MSEFLHAKCPFEWEILYAYDETLTISNTFISLNNGN
jgi:hypothetical protein